jgi:hypothetical protein
MCKALNSLHTDLLDIKDNNAILKEVKFDETVKSRETPVLSFRT